MFREAAAFVMMAAAAAAPPAPPPPAMTFTLVRAESPACAPDCPEWIAAEGAIVPGTAHSFRAFLARLDRRRRPILIQSGGGSIEDALEMGRLIRANGLAVAVARTVLAPGAPNDPAHAAAGSALGYRAYCFSACTIVLAAGVERYASPFAAVGVHQTLLKLSQTTVYRRYLVHYRIVNGQKREVSREEISENRKTVASTQVSPAGVNTRLIAYFKEMGEDPDIVALMQTATPQNIHIMTEKELEDTRLVTVWINQPSAMDTARDDNGLAGLPVLAGAGGGAVLLAGQTWPIAPTKDGLARDVSLELAMRRGGGGVTATFSRSAGDNGFLFALAPGAPDDKWTSSFYPAAAFCHLAEVGVLEARAAPPATPTQAPGEPDPRAPLLTVRLAAVEGESRLAAELCGGAGPSRK